MLLKPRLPIYKNQEPDVCLVARSLEIFLDPINTWNMHTRLGIEESAWRRGHIEKTHGQLFTNGRGSMQGMRYLYHGPDGQIAACLHISVINAKPVLSTIFVRKDKRKRGFAKEMLHWALRDYPNLTVDPNMTKEGAMFFGYVPSIAKSSGMAATGDATKPLAGRVYKAGRANV